MISTHVFGAIAAVAAIPLALTAFDRTPGLIVSDRAPLSARADPGGSLVIRYHATHKRDCSVRFHRAIVDSAGQKFPLTSETIDAPAADETIGDVTTIPVPLAARPGVASYEVTFESRCSLIQQMRPVRGTLPPIQFIVADSRPIHRKDMP